MRLLIAEDEVDLAEALTVFLRKIIFSADAVHNGRDHCLYGAAAIKNAYGNVRR